MYWCRRLPHWIPNSSEIFVTWRLAGPKPSPPSLPKTGGPQWLDQPRIANMFVEALLYGEQVRRSYCLFAWVVMPNHVHLVLKPTCPLPDIMRWLKGATSNRANRLLGTTGTAFWQREYFDRWIRSDQQLNSVIAYVEENPVRKGLVASPEEWPWSSTSKEPAARPPALPVPTKHR